ncbi:hypothetical protein Ais01nite_72350 [Asanoa ishikariensis]|nr:hypothetical protein Ais01nite_72350 [Asanoa ishikariensis]
MGAGCALLLAAVAAGVIAQGGFYPGGRLAVCGLVVTALVVGRTRLDRRVIPFALTAGALAVWTVVRGSMAGGYWPAVLGTVGTLAVLVAAVALVLRADPVQRAALVLGLTGVGVLVAVTGWVGVAFRVPIWAVAVEGRLWRASSTLTYPNAAAAVLCALALLALAALAARPASVPRALTAFVLVTGLGATQSRAGLIAFAVGLGLLAWLRRRLFAGPLLGAVVAVGALLPTTPVGAAPRPWLAVAGLVAGALVAVLRHRAALVALAAGIAAVAALAPDRWDAVLANRGTFASWGRSNAISAALDQVAAQPWAGSGPGLARFVWLDSAGDAVVARFVHNEYLQLAVELGLVGAALLGLVLAAAAAIVTRGGGDVAWAGPAAALVGFAVHSAFDFLWQLAALPLLAGLLVGLASQHTADRPKTASVHGGGGAPSITGEEEKCQKAEEGVS